MINIGNININRLVGTLGPALGGPVGSLLSAIPQGQLGKLPQMLKGLMGGFGKAGGVLPSHGAQRPLPFSPKNITMVVVMNPAGALQQPASSGPLQNFAKAPIVGNDSQWGSFANAVNSRITGNDKSFNFSGTNPWVGGGDKNEMAAIGWAMQKNDKVRFDADRKQFYVTNADGSKRDVASLDEVKAEIARNGGANPSNGKAFNAVGSFMESRVNSAASKPAQKAPSNANPFQELLKMIEKLVKALTGGQAGGASAASGSGAASGSSGASAAAPAASTSSSGGGGAIDNMINSAGSKIDNLMGQAEKLMASDKMSDQLKGQRMMQQAMRLFEMISKMLEQRSQMQAKAIQAIK